MDLDLTRAQRRSAALAAALGNALEWFDFAVYGYFATAIGKAFFPEAAVGMQTVEAFGVFAVGYLMRPVGSLVLGPIGDVLGRRRMLTISILIMGASSLLIGLLPTHAQLGVTAGYLLVLLRMLQGFSVGGEYTGSMAYTTEAAPSDRQGFLSSLATAGALLGFVLGSLTAALLAGLLGVAAVDDWAWRLPFLVGAVVAALGWWLRRHMPETLAGADRPLAHFNHRQTLAAIARQLRQVLHQWPLMLRVAALISFSNVVFYILFVFLVDYSGHQPGGRMADANAIATVIQALGMPVVVAGGWLADRVGRVTLTRWTTLALTGLTLPCILGAQTGGVSGLIIGQGLAMVPIMLLFGAQGVLIARLVDPKERCAVFSISYSLAIALFAGTAPLVAGWLLSGLNLTWGPALYCLLFAIPALAALKGLHQD